MQTVPMDAQKEKINRLERQLAHQQAVLQEAYCEMGKRLLEAARQENERIDRLVDEIIATRKALATAQQQSSCPHCLTINDADSFYCKRCGQQLEK